MVAVREVFTRFGVQFDRNSAKRADQAISGLIRGARTLANVFVAGAAANAVRGLVNETAELGDTIAKTSARLGVSGQSLQTLRFAAERTGVTTQRLDKGLQLLGTRAAEAANGTGEARLVFEELGLQLRDANGNVKAADSLFRELADTIQGVESSSDRLRIAQKLFGEDNSALLNTLMAGSDGISELEKRFIALGGVMGGNLQRDSENYKDTLLDMTVAMQGVRNTLAAELLPFFRRSSEQTIRFLQANRQIIRQNIGTFFERVARLGRGLNDAIEAVSDTVTTFFENLTPEQKKLAGIAAGLVAVGAALKVIGFVIRAGFIGKLLLLSSLIGFLIEDWQTFKEGADSAIGRTIEFIDNLLGEAGATEKFFRETLPASFQTMLAEAQAVGVQMLAVFTPIVDSIRNAFASLFEGDIPVFFDSVNAALDQWVDLVFTALGKLAKHVVDFFRSPANNRAILEGLFGLLQNAQDLLFGVVELIGKQILRLGEGIGKFFFTALGGDVESGQTATTLGGSEIGRVAPRIEDNFFSQLFGTPDEIKAQARELADSFGIGAGASATAPAASAAAVGGRSVVVNNSPTSTTNVNVNAPGGSGQEIADAVVSRMREETDRSLRLQEQNFTNAAAVSP